MNSKTLYQALYTSTRKIQDMEKVFGQLQRVIASSSNMTIAFGEIMKLRAGRRHYLRRIARSKGKAWETIK